MAESPTRNVLAWQEPLRSAGEGAAYAMSANLPCPVFGKRRSAGKSDPLWPTSESVGLR
jgi:hypothetical protein